MIASRRTLAGSGLAPCDAILRSFSYLALQKGHPWRTVLAISANSAAAVEAALLAARQACCPIFFAATLNQVDADGGYTGWTHAGFTSLVRRMSKNTGFRGPVLMGVDHAGPWLKDKHAAEKWPYRKTLAAVKRSLHAAIFAGFDLLHIDPTVDIELPAGKALPVGTVVDRTVLLIKSCEAYRRKHGLPAVSYEVGTEEVKGGLADEDMFQAFLSGLRKQLTWEGLSDAWPCFIVGKVGTDLHTTMFDPKVAWELYHIARPYGLVLKGHYTDNVDNPAAYPASRMGGANVGPEFTEAECDALAELEVMEKSGNRTSGQASKFAQALKQAVLRSGRWQKWLHPDERGKPFALLSPERQDWLVRTGARYIWTDPDVLSARSRLYANLKQDGLEAHNYVVERVAHPILKYIRAFNLENTIPVLEDELRRRAKLPFWGEGQVLAAGEMIVEIMRPGVDQPLNQQGRFAGPFPSGAPAIFADAAARIGKRTGFIGSLGDDDFGDLLLGRFARDGLDSSLVNRVRHKSTGCAFVSYEKSGARKFIFHIAGTGSDQLPSPAAAARYAESFRHMHLMGCSLAVSRAMRENCYAIAEAVKQAGGSVSLDPNLRPELLSASECREILMPVVRMADIILPSGGEASLLMQETDADRACRRLLDMGIQIVVLKLGEDGCRVYTHDAVFGVPGFSVNAVDPTGAGDCFDAGFISGYLDNLPLIDSARLANAMGALAASKLGPMEGAFSLKEVLAFMRTQEKRTA
jgi:D-tagatose-1,6-bisphosphate aldolase subunit GatZ/KbaZ